MPLKPIAYVQASWHTDITEHCKTAFMAELAKHGYGADDIEFFSAPGSLEIPLLAKKLAKTGRYAAVCASGLVVNGGIYRHEFVAQAVLQGIVQTSLETEVPVLSAVLTPHHFHEHAVHEEFFKNHMRTKGKELAEACVSIIERLSAVAALTA
ncbi:MAG TPA: 6,7-dimethyl-8-ribityllumazine synthase [Methylomirabilota bacterium]|jgi:6,7-dimethyl-8-ribityllumazine synthase